MDASAIDRAAADTRGWTGLAVGEWAVVVAAAVLLLSLPAFDWFAFSDREQLVTGSKGNAFRWLDGSDYLLLVAGLVAAGAPLARLTGLVSATPRAVAVATGAAGLIAAVVITGLIVSPPDLERGFLTVPVGGGPTAETIVRGGAAVGLLAALGVVALSALTIAASPAALSPVRRPTPEPTAPAQEHTSKPRREAEPRPRAAPKRKPKPKPPSRPSLATATTDDLVGVGFTPTQAARIVEHRDDLGKVTKLADLKRVPGIARPVLAELAKRLDE